MNEKLNAILTELRRQLEALYGSRLVRLILYGSQARGDAEPGSDIDILVVLQGPVKPGEEILRVGKITAALSLKYTEVISCVFVSADRFEQEQNPLLINVRREGITISDSPQMGTISQSMGGAIQETRETYITVAEVNQASPQGKTEFILERGSAMKPEQLALLHKAADSLKAARLLADQGFHNFAASRAYYTMFYIASAFLLGEGFTFSKHSTVITMFGQHFAKTGRVPVEFHRYLIEAEDRRKVGDYGIGPGLDEAEVIIQITRAEQFLKLAEGLIGPIL